LWLVTLVLVVREVYLERSGNANSGPGVVSNNKDNVAMEEQGAPGTSDPNL